MEKIHQDKYQEKKYKTLILKALKQKKEGATIADVVVLTGLLIDWVEYTLRLLMAEYPCRLKINDKDELVYIFDFETPTKNWQQILLEWAKSSHTIKHLQKPKQFIYQTLSYIFGEKRKAKDRLFIEKIILHYIRHNQGKVVIAELIQVTGWSVYQAEIQATRLLANYHGEVEITEEGVIIYHFEELARQQLTVSEQQEVIESLKIWERPIPERKMNDNDEITNQKLEKFNKTNLFTSSLVSMITGALIINQPFGFLANLLLLGSTTALSFSAVFFLLPAIRKFFVFLENEKIRSKNVETYLLKGIFNRINSRISPDKDLKKLLHESKPLKEYAFWWNRYLSSSVFEYSLILTSTYHRELLLQKKALELEAEINVDQNGDLYYDFERLNKELEIIAQQRK
ncbi:MAG: hypothetical protein NW226_21895 [Microscillaceae bacterium]|nr:hypothetical protein [Microscillaceae bacterium]